MQRTTEGDPTQATRVSTASAAAPLLGKRRQREVSAFEDAGLFEDICPGLGQPYLMVEGSGSPKPLGTNNQLTYNNYQPNTMTQPLVHPATANAVSLLPSEGSPVCARTDPRPALLLNDIDLKTSEDQRRRWAKFLGKTQKLPRCHAGAKHAPHSEAKKDARTEAVLARLDGFAPAQAALKRLFLQHDASLCHQLSDLEPSGKPPDPDLTRLLKRVQASCCLRTSTTT